MHGLDHVVNELLECGSHDIPGRDGLGDSAQHGMPQAANFQNCHISLLGFPQSAFGNVSVVLLSPAQTRRLFTMKRQYPVALAMLGNQSSQTHTVDQYAALTARQTSGWESKQLVRHNHDTP